jgi:hypothetical protein
MQRVSFLVPEKMLLKIKAKMVAPFEQLKSRVVSAPVAVSHSQMQQQPGQQQQPPQQQSTFIPAFPI